MSESDLEFARRERSLESLESEDDADHDFRNGKTSNCSMPEIFAKWQDKAERAMTTVEMRFDKVEENTGHLIHLASIKDSLSSLLEAHQETRQELLGAATGRKQIDLQTFNYIVKMLCLCQGLLILALIFLITGEKMGWFNLAG